MAPPNCHPLVQFTDRLFFTSWRGPAPPQHIINSSIQGPEDYPLIKRPIAPVDNQHAKYYFFTVDNQLTYLSFFEDWGPYNLANVFRACILFHELLQDKDNAEHRIVLYSSDDPRKKANAALLLALYVQIVLHRPPWEAFHPLADMELMPFRDAGRARPDFNLSIQDCLWGIWKAMQNGLCNMNEFSVDEYEYYEKVENGDWNWITPGFIAFASPVDNAWIAKQNGDKSSKHSALQRRLPIPFQNCLDYFEKKHIKIVVRLNQPLYDKQVFLDRGIDHMELYFDDGTNPTDEIVRTFINVADAVTSKGGVVAVHCKAGLGRTGTLIGAYLIWKYGFTANEAIAFMRIVRPGSVVGPQQHYMYLKQLEWNKWAAADEVRRAAENQAEENGRVTPDMQIDRIPPVTPSRHVLATTAAVQEIANPPQPRKTPRSKRTVVEDMMDEDVPTLNLTLNEEERDHSGPLPPTPMKPLSRPAPTRRPVSRAAANGPIAATTSPSSTPSGRQTRSVTAKASANQTEASSPTRAAAAVLGGRIPRLTRAKDTDSALPSAMTTRSRAAGKPPPPETPSRLPKPRIPAKRTYVTLEMDSGNESGPTENSRAPATNGRAGASSPTGRSTRRKSAGAKLKLVEDPSTSTEWVRSQEAVAVVEPAATKGGRPSLRNVKRRRSSFSSADVVA